MATDPMIIGQVGFQQVHQMSLVKHHHVIKQLSPYAADQAFHERILPGRKRCNYYSIYPHTPQTVPHLAAVDAVAVANQVARSRVEVEGLSQLLGNPRS